jgi:polyphenol oxidase
LSAASPPAFRAEALAGVRHGFFGREGGVSGGIYASLNAGTGSDDDAVAVADNRALIAQAMGVEPTHLIGVHQVHSPDAVFVDAPWTGERPRADALVTTARGLAISVLTADCTPVLLADVDAGVIGAAHAGWKGALGGVLENAVALMRTHGAKRIVAAIGPCIHQPWYEVGPEFEAAFVARDTGFARYFVPGVGDRRLFDLPGFCADRLKDAGVSQIETLPLDTYAEESRLFSHRRSVHRKEPGYGRNCAVITL